ncbi:MAG: phosphonate transport system substrate-binding protein [Desulforhopalus sp.]|jgi:phosphonate transport system substrate-binding protein
MKFKVLTIILFVVVLTCNVPAQAEDQYRFGVFPYLPPSKLLQLFIPIANDLSSKLGKKVRVTSKPDYKSFREGLNEEQYDIAFVQPFDYVQAHDLYQYQPLAKREQDLSALIIVPIQSELKSLDDLKGRVIANPPKIAAVSHLTSMALVDKGIDPQKDVQRLYTKNHFSCMQSVLIGTADACGTAAQAMAHFEEKEMTKRFRVLHQTKPVSHSLFVAHTRVPESDRKLIQQTILSWADTEAGKEILKNGKFISFVAAEDHDYDTIRTFWQRQEQ